MWLWDRCPFDQQWNDGDFPAQGGFHLQPHVVAGLIEAPLALLIDGVDPTRTDHHQHDVTVGHHPVDVLSKVDTQRGVVDVVVHVVRTEVTSELIVDASCDADRVPAPIREEHPQCLTVAETHDAKRTLFETCRFSPHRSSKALGLVSMASKRLGSHDSGVDILGGWRKKTCRCSSALTGTRYQQAIAKRGPTLRAAAALGAGVLTEWMRSGPGCPARGIHGSA